VDQWIRDLIAASVSGIRKLADAAIERISVIYSLIVTAGLALRSGWGRLLSIFYYWRDRFTNLAHEYYLTMYYIITIRIPMYVSHKVDEALRYLSTIISTIENRIVGTVNALSRWVGDWINRIVDTANRLADWALREINRILDTLGRVALLVFTLLTDPRRMAKWILGALVAELIKFVSDNADTILEAARKRSIVYAGRIAERIEEVLVRML